MGTNRKLLPSDDMYQEIVNHPEIMRIMERYQQVKMSRRKCIHEIANVIYQMGYVRMKRGCGK